MLGLLLVGGAACKAKTGAAPSTSSVPRASGVGQVPSAALGASGAAVVPTSALREDEAKSFVARWEAAQNAGDFKSYERLYADRFMGVKRVGSYSNRYDRARWLLDRKPMLERGAKVTVTDLEIVVAAGSTRATFTQEFKSKGFRDIGQKELFLVTSPGGVVISREEMLSSEVAATGPSDESVLAYHRDGAVLQRGFEKRLLRTRPRLLSSAQSSSVDIAFEVPGEALSAGSRAWLGRELTTYSSSGQTCRGRVARFEVRVQAVPHFGMRQTWNGEHETPRATPEQIAASVAAMAQSTEHFVVGVLDQPCRGSWATSAAHAFTPARPAAGKLRALGVTAFKALPAYVALQRKFVKETADEKRAWEAADGALNVVELRVPGRSALLLVAARGSTACDGFGGALSALWELAGTTEAPTLTPVTKTYAEHLTLVGAIDEGGAAGVALFLGPDNFEDELAVLRLGSPQAARRVLFSTSFWDCGC